MDKDFIKKKLTVLGDMVERLSDVEITEEQFDKIKKPIYEVWRDTHPIEDIQVVGQYADIKSNTIKDGENGA